MPSLVCALWRWSFINAAHRIEHFVFAIGDKDGSAMYLNDLFKPLGFPLVLYPWL